MDMEAMMKSLMGEMGSDPSMAADAQRLWKMLDDLAESDPQAYGKFLSSQMEGAKEAAPKAETKPAFCMQCKLKNSASPLAVFINVTHCREVAEPYRDEGAKRQRVSVPGRDDDSDEEAKGGDDDLTGMRIPIARTKEAPSSDPKVPSVYEVAINTLAALRAAKEPAFKRMLELTVLAAAAQFFKLDLAPSYSIASEKFRGDKTEPVLLSLAQRSGPGGGGGGTQQDGAGRGGGGAKKPLIQEVGPGAAPGGGKGAKAEGGRAGAEGAGGGPRGGGGGGGGGPPAQPLKSLETPESLLESLRSRNGGGGGAALQGGGDDEGRLSMPASGTAPKAGAGGGRKVLIEEVVRVPDHRVERKGDALVLTAEMPLAGGVGEMDLIVSERQVSVRSPQYELKVTLDASVDSDAVSAKFSKKTRCLVLKLPVLA